MYCKKKKSIWINIFVYMFSIIFFLSFISLNNFNFSYAEENYSNVLEDLQKDETFNVEDYPLVENDYTLQVIQIAESSNKELFIYVYQPFYKENATSINISTGINDNLKYENYTLTYLNNVETLYKYKVNNFKVKDDALRYYDISSIFRNWNADMDEGLEDDNVIDEVSFEVAKLFTVSTVNGEVSYTCLTTETIEITNKHVGFIRYLNGFWLWEESCDSHYVAFSTDKSIDKLMEADITYIAEIGSGSFATGNFNIKKTEIKSETILPEEVSNDPTGPFGNKYTWNRIEKVSDFIANSDNDLTEETKNSLKNMQWVLRFSETSYVEYNGMYYPHYEATRISEVTILRLKFETNGEIFNLGIVDNKQSGDSIPDNNQNWLQDIVKLILKILVVILAVVLFIVCWPIILPVLTWIIKIIFVCLKYIFKGLLWLITAPFTVISKK